jgi:hypothetical protein
MGVCTRIVQGDDELDVCMMRYNSVRWSAAPYVGMDASR